MDVDAYSKVTSSLVITPTVQSKISPVASPKELDRTHSSAGSATLDTNKIMSSNKADKSRQDGSSNMIGAGEGLPQIKATAGHPEKPLQDLVTWIDKITFSRQRRHLHRDFSDGVLMAELVAHFFPKMIELHNYAGANNTNLKKNNWDLLNRKILPKLGIKLQDSAIESICIAKPGYIEPVLNQVRKLIEKKSEEDDLAKARELAGDCGDVAGGSSGPLTEETCLVNILSNHVPEFVIFRGQKYFPEESVEQKKKTIEELREKNKEMTNKVRRLETLVGLKENHLEDLTRQLHQLRIKLGNPECVCQWEEGSHPPRVINFN